MDHLFSASDLFYEFLESGILNYYWLIIWQVLKNWAWVVLPFLLWKLFKFHWIFWRNEIFDAKEPNILLEIRIPKEVLKPVRAMELVLTGWWQIYAWPNWHEMWWDGQYLMSFTMEIAAIEGVPHFLIRIPKKHRHVFETHIYSQYPEAEIFEVEDYTLKAPRDVPNKDWEMWGTNYKLFNPSAYPIKTYLDFETEREAKEEKRIDPMASILEGMSRLKKGEQLWLQIKARPFMQELYSWIKEGKEIRDNLVKRTKPKTRIKSIPERAMEFAVHGEIGSDKVTESKEVIPPEMKLTPGERDVVAGIERKIGKLGFEVNIRYIYLAKRENFFGGNIRLIMSYFTNFLNSNSNGLVPDGKTITKVKKNWYDFFWFYKRRTYLRKRRMFKNYIRRAWTPFPFSGDSFVLNTEELASIFHFPSQITSPSSMIPRVESKRGEPPADLPVE